MDIRDLHPLRFTADITQILPFLSYCKKRKPIFRSRMRQAILNDMGIKIPESEKEQDDEPFLQLGYGVNSYFDSMKMLGYMFIWISIFCTPLYIAFSSNSMIGMKELVTGFKFKTQQFTLGNMGGTESNCISTRLEQKNLLLSCSNGIDGQMLYSDT